MKMTLTLLGALLLAGCYQGKPVTDCRAIAAALATEGEEAREVAIENLQRHEREIARLPKKLSNKYASVYYFCLEVYRERALSHADFTVDIAGHRPRLLRDMAGWSMGIRYHCGRAQVAGRQDWVRARRAGDCRAALAVPMN